MQIDNMLRSGFTRSARKEVGMSSRYRVEPVMEGLRQEMARLALPENSALGGGNWAQWAHHVRVLGV